MRALCVLGDQDVKLTTTSRSSLPLQYKNLFCFLVENNKPPLIGRSRFIAG